MNINRVLLFVIFFLSWQVLGQENDYILKSLSYEWKFDAKVMAAIDTDLKQVSKDYQELSAKKCLPLPLSVEAQRFINVGHWEEAQTKMPERPWEFYGQKTIQDWQAALDHVNSFASIPAMSKDVLKDIHRLAYRNSFFVGHEERYLKRCSEDKLMDHYLQFKDALTSLNLHEAVGWPKDHQFPKIYQFLYDILEDTSWTSEHGKHLKFSGIPQERLLGHFRHEDTDRLEFFGSYEKGLSAKDLTTIRSRPDLYEVDWDSRQKEEDGLTKVHVYFRVHPDIDQKVDVIMDHLHSQLKDLNQSQELLPKVSAIIHAQLELMGHHPFLDGNGRSIRLFGDLLFRFLNLPPPLYPNEEDLTMEREDHLLGVIKGMKDYVSLGKLHCQQRIF